MSGNHSDPALRAIEKHCTKQLWSALQLEENLAKQKARIQWLALGDRNTAFFAKCTKQRWNSNKILSLQDDNGSRITEQPKICLMAEQYFYNLLGRPPSTSYSGHSQMAKIITSKIPIEQTNHLICQVSDEEIYNTLRSMKRNKSPGPDGFNVDFFLHTWEIVGQDFIKAIQHFFASSHMHKGTNATAIALIPKVNNPSSMADFRPISCCNTTYKCISKIIATRLKSVLPGLISPTQSAFVPGRKIGDNILLAQELFRNYHRTKGPAKCSLKIDIRKAFDSVRWDFLFDCLVNFGLPVQFIAWIKSCITTAMFSVKVNGTLCGFFQGAKGLRQGDPLSPYLFVLVMEVLAQILKHCSTLPDFKFHWRTKACGITHLCFADDLLVFCHGDLKSVTIIKEGIDLFSSLSGLLPNHAKSSCFLANIPSHQQDQIVQLLGFPLGQLPIKFLGVPLISSKLSYQDCVPLIHAISSKVCSWTNTSLSYSGRLQLIKSVLFSMQSYWSSCFILPKAAIRGIQQILSRFLWKGASLAKHGTKVAWKKVALPFSEGGLGIKSLEDWNKALIIVHLWNIVQFHSTSTWASWIKNTVIKDKFFWQLPIPSDCSWIWRQVLKLRRTAQPYISYKIGNGASISLWFDPWSNNPPLQSAHDPIIVNSGLSPFATVQTIIDGSSWNLPSSNHSDVISWRLNFDMTRKCNAAIPDQILWDGAAHRKLKASHVWHSIRSSAPTVTWAQLVWHKLHVPRFSFISWLALQHKLPTAAVLHNYGLQVSPLCHLCHLHDETLDHLFFQCHYSSEVLSKVYLHGGWLNMPDTISHMVQHIASYHGPKIAKHVQFLCLNAIIYKLWQERNNRFHRKESIPDGALAADTINLIKCRLTSATSFIQKLTKHPFLLPWHL